ncbi:lysophospholipid acyltransferase family protein [Megalodesulfovibrio gigas]|uniref:lysophospholipid acyltransferase family protein n=1 Tax=Megalodesulfovibrio gigas TaxID=879 RepID=UPI000411E3F4|nr:lysophospholipid acyltransferase family protein [Megalodesulfovibrio gigas]
MQSFVTLLRSLRFQALFLPGTILFSLLCVGMRKLGLMQWRSWAAWGWGQCGMLGAGVPVETHLEHLPPPGPMIIMANHQSQLDICLFFTRLRKYDCCFVAKKPLFKLPFLGKAMHALGHVCVDQDNPRQAMKAIDEAIEKARAGQAVVIFPEGTRAFTFETLQEFQVGAMILALKSGLPVVPVLIHGAGDVSARETMKINKPNGPLRLTALPVLHPCERYTMKDREALRQELQTLMTTEYERLRGLYYPRLAANTLEAR